MEPKEEWAAAELRRLNAEADMLEAKAAKLVPEALKLKAETAKLQADDHRSRQGAIAEFTRLTAYSTPRRLKGAGVLWNHARRDRALSGWAGPQHPG